MLVAHALSVVLVREPVILQPALTRLVADGAIHGMIEQQQLLHLRPSLQHFGGRVALHFQVLRGSGLTCRQELRLLDDDVVLRLRVPGEDIERQGLLSGRGQDFDETHAAVGRHREAGVPAVVRDFDACSMRGTDDRVSLFEGDFASVEFERRHRGSSSVRAWGRGREGRPVVVLRHHWSHSPPIMLIEPKVGTTSGIIRPLRMSPSPCTMAKQGGRIRTR